MGASAQSVIMPVWFNFAADELAWTRPVFGYGPEIFPYIASLTTPATVHNVTAAPFLYAHNHLVHVFVELGFWGLVIYLGLLASVLWAGGASLRLHSLANPSERRWFTIAILAGVIGWTVAGLSGIPRIGDMTLFWVLLGTLVALPRVFQREDTAPDAVIAPRVSGSRAARRRAGQRTPGPHPGRLFVGSILAVVVIAFTLTYNVSHLRASSIANEGVQLLREGRPHTAMDRLDRAIELAPEFPLYYLERAQTFEALAQAAAGSEQQLDLLQRAYEQDTKALGLDRYSWQAVETTALTLVAMVDLGEEDKRDEAIALLRQLTTMIPYNYRTYEQLGHIEWVLGAPEAALEALDESLALTEGTAAGARSYLLRSLALNDLSRTQDSIDAVEQALELGLADLHDRSEAHFFLAGLYQEMGDEARVAEHLRAYDELQRQQ